MGRIIGGVGGGGGGGGGAIAPLPPCSASPAVGKLIGMTVSFSYVYAANLTDTTLMHIKAGIIESVDSISRDGTDTPYM